MSTDREAIISRIRKLRKMTETAGCTEAEALSAINLIAKLMAEHGLTDSETQLKADASGCLTDYIIVMQKSYDEFNGLGSAIARLYATKIYLESGTIDILDIGMGEPCIYVKFFGFPSDVIAATATMAICVNAVNAESATTITKGQEWGRQGSRRFLSARLSFRIGMVGRLIERLNEIVAARKAAPTTGTGLIVLKDQLVDQEWAKQGIALTRRSGGPSLAINPVAHALGKAAGNRVDLGQGPRMGQSTTRRLGN